MLPRKKVVSVQDHERLKTAVDRARSSWLTYAPCLDSFRTGLRTAQAVPPAEVPGDMITMNSRFAVLDPRTGQSICYTLVYPEHESREKGKLSVLSPMGMALLAARVGDEVRWTSGDGPEVARVQNLLYQPEKAGDQNL